MKKIDLGQTIGILANLGIVAGIVFLAIELRQNNDLLEAQTRATRLDVRQGDSLIVLNNPDLAQALVKHRNREELTAYEEVLLARYMEVALTGFQYVYQEMASGATEVSIGSIEAMRSQFSEQTLSVPGYWPVLTDYWEESKFTYDPEFVQWLEENVVNPAQNQ